MASRARGSCCSRALYACSVTTCPCAACGDYESVPSDLSVRSLHVSALRCSVADLPKVSEASKLSISSAVMLDPHAGLGVAVLPQFLLMRLHGARDWLLVLQQASSRGVPLSEAPRVPGLSTSVFRLKFNFRPRQTNKRFQDQLVTKLATSLPQRSGKVPRRLVARKSGSWVKIEVVVERMRIP
jgi:hypothetical protein